MNVYPSKRPSELTDSSETDKRTYIFGADVGFAANSNQFQLTCVKNELFTLAYSNFGPLGANLHSSPCARCMGIPAEKSIHGVLR